MLTAAWLGTSADGVDTYGERRSQCPECLRMQREQDRIEKLVDAAVEKAMANYRKQLRILYMSQGKEINQPMRVWTSTGFGSKFSES